MTLEVRLSNRGAQEMYKRFGFTPVGVRKGYYADTGEDALIMWAYEVSEPAYRRLLAGIERSIQGSTVVDRLRGWS
jgi:ribosomal-protein-alanine N-acetyltransferase